MPYPPVVTPIAARQSFTRADQAAAQSQAAFLLLLGRRLRGDEEVLETRAKATGAASARADLFSEEQQFFDLPPLRAISGRTDLGDMEKRLQQRYGGLARSEELLRRPDVVVDLVDRLYKNPNAYSAAELMEASVYSPDELVRVSAASSYFDLRPEKSKLVNILIDGTYSEDDLVRDVAATSLSHVAPEHERLRSMAPTGASGATSGSLNTTILIHGTFARSYPWWKPNGDFHNYILTQVRSDLYAGADYFGWSGGYSDNARSQGADSLADWIKQRPSVRPPDLITHSHGGSLVMLATLSGLQIGSLTLLSCPVHVHKYLPEFSNLKKVISVRVHLDLVILADRGGQRFDHPNIKENVLPLWFDHSATHSPEVWQEYNIRSML